MECQWLTGLSAGDDLKFFFRPLNQRESTGDGLALNRLAMHGNKRLWLTGLAIRQFGIRCSVQFSSVRVFV